jgi:hypothetical protein
MNPQPQAKGARGRLRNLVLLLLAIGVLLVAAVLVRGMGPSRAVVEQRTADRTQWEAGRTADQRAGDQAWAGARRAEKRQRVLMATSTLLGNILVLATCIVSARRDIALPGLAGRATLALLAAGLLLFGVAALDKAIAGGEGMFSGERGLVAMVALLTFLATWLVSLGGACVFVWRRRRRDALHHPRQP